MKAEEIRTMDVEDEKLYANLVIEHTAQAAEQTSILERIAVALEKMADKDTGIGLELNNIAISASNIDSLMRNR